MMKVMESIQQPHHHAYNHDLHYYCCYYRYYCLEEEEVCPLGQNENKHHRLDQSDTPRWY